MATVANGREVLATTLSTVYRCSALMHAHRQLQDWSTNPGVWDALVARRAPVGVVQPFVEWLVAGEVMFRRELIPALVAPYNPVAMTEGRTRSGCNSCCSSSSSSPHPFSITLGEDDTMEKSGAAQLAYCFLSSLPPISSLLSLLPAPMLLPPSFRQTLTLSPPPTLAPTVPLLPPTAGPAPRPADINRRSPVP